MKLFLMIIVTFALATPTKYANEKENKNVVKELEFVVKELEFLTSLSEADDYLTKKYGVPYNYDDKRFQNEITSILDSLHQKFNKEKPKNYDDFITHQPISDQDGGWIPVVLYEHSNYNGAALDPTNHTIDVTFGSYNCYQCRKISNLTPIAKSSGGNWNDVISSAKMKANQGADLSAYIFHKHDSYTGPKTGCILSGPIANYPTSVVANFQDVHHGFLWWRDDFNDQITSLTMLNVWSGCNTSVNFECQ